MTPDRPETPNPCSEDTFRRAALSDASAAVTVLPSDTGGFVIALRQPDTQADLLLGTSEPPSDVRIFDDIGACARTAAQLSPNRQVWFDLGLDDASA